MIQAATVACVVEAVSVELVSREARARRSVHPRTVGWMAEEEELSMLSDLEACAMWQGLCWLMAALERTRRACWKEHVGVRRACEEEGRERRVWRAEEERAY